jgi:hypothetical protein
MVGFDVAGMAKPNDEVSLPVVGMMAVRFTASLAILGLAMWPRLTRLLMRALAL